MQRRYFLGSLAAASIAGTATWLRPQRTATITGAILGASESIGHRLRTRDFPTPTENRKVPVVIVGGGIAGLSAAWKLQKAGFHDFELLELETDVGGNSRSGRNSISAYPWGAHYLPFPTRESTSVRELLAELEVIQGDPYAEKPFYDERYISFAPQERLYLHGAWQQGLLPDTGIPQRDKDQYRRFHDLLKHYRDYRDREGRKAFAIPVEKSSRDPALLQLDKLSFRDYLLQQGLDSPYLHWYADYACRDDYGCSATGISAWAGLHYFASRDGKAQNVTTDAVLTWPEGNGWIVNKLKEKLTSYITSQRLVYHLSERDQDVLLHVYYPEENRSSAINAHTVIWACPVFQLPYVHSACPQDLQTAVREFEYSPWLVANLSLNGLPTPSWDAPLAWDNVIYDSPALGYVVATHQQLVTHQEQTVLTWYYALAGTAVEGRKRLLQTSWQEWAQFILNDLSRPHPEIRGLISHLDLMRWGHAMVRPRPGFLFGAARQQVLKHNSRVLLAHADLSGYSIFEEAHYRGIMAAAKILEQG